jgi:hypothetical protein
MRREQRPRRYVASYWLMMLTPLMRYSATRDAYVLRAIGGAHGPVLRPERRRARRGEHAFDGAERPPLGRAEP